MSHGLDRDPLFAIQVGFRHGQPRGHFAHFAPLDEFHLEDVEQDPLAGKAAFPLRLDLIHGIAKQGAQGVGEVTVILTGQCLHHL